MTQTSLELSPATAVIRALFNHKDARRRHLDAPMLQERAAYLNSLLMSGCNQRFVSERASTLLHVVRLFSGCQGSITEAHIAAAGKAWAAERSSANSHKTTANFKAGARSWFRYLGKYDQRAKRRFESSLEEFSSALTRDFGYRDSTKESCLSAASRFLAWMANENASLATVELKHVVAYLHERVEGGWSRRTAINEARCLRAFFRYAETRGLSTATISRTLRFVPTADAPTIEFPSWSNVREMLSVLDCANPSHCRARGILLLASVYGLRRSELVRLSLDSIDWRENTLTVQRAKRGRLQKFPLQPEVRQAISCYLRHVRPLSNHRALFLTLQTPSRPATNLGPAMRKVMASTQVFTREWGLHSLRHACATELLRRGTPLKRIAEFLGHKGMGSISIYAHQDIKGLRRVAAIDLAGAL